MKVDGVCHCGAVRCEAEVRPELVVLCHCILLRLTASEDRSAYPLRLKASA